MEPAGAVLRIRLCWSVFCLEMRLRVTSELFFTLAVKPWSDPPAGDEGSCENLITLVTLQLLCSFGTFLVSRVRLSL